MGPVPEQVLPGTSTGPLHKVNTLNPKPFTLHKAGISGGGTPRPSGQEDPDPSPQHVQRGCSKTCFFGFSGPLEPGAPLGPPGPPWAPFGFCGPPWAPLGPPGPPCAPLRPGLPSLTEPPDPCFSSAPPLAAQTDPGLGPWFFSLCGGLFFVKSRDGMKKFYVKKAVGLSLGLNPKRNRFGWLCRLGRRGVGEKC